jgi:uncharacterized protein YjcR
MSTQTNKVQIRPYNVTELARMYTVTPRTMKKWLQRHPAIIEDKMGQLFTILQVEKIFDKFGTPRNTES